MSSPAVQLMMWARSLEASDSFTRRGHLVHVERGRHGQFTNVVDPSDIIPVHDAFDADKLEALAESMRANGWIGAEVVVAGDQALTGSHRLAAAEEAGTDVPIVDIADLTATYGHSWTELLADFDWSDRPWYDAAARLADYLPADVIEYYGLDIH